jgi:hypothetical protein
MWNAVLLSLWLLSLSFTTAAAATNKNSVAASTARLQNRLPPKSSSAAPRLVTPSPSPIKSFNRPGGYYSLGGSQQRRPVPLPSISNSSAPLVRQQPSGVRASYGRSEYSNSRAALERRQPVTPPKLGFSAKAFRLRSHRR